MLWRVALAAFLTLCIATFAINAPRAQFNGCPTGFCTVYPASGGCTQSNSYFASASDITGADKTSIATFICNGFTQNGSTHTWATVLDGLYLAANKTEADFEINMVNPGSFTATKTGTVTFTAYQGVTGDGSTGFYDTGFVESTAGGNASLNSVTIGYCSATATGGTTSPMGDLGSANGFLTINVATTPSVEPFLNDATGSGVGAAASAGVWAGVRTGSAATVTYRNGVSQATSTDSSVNMSNHHFYLVARNSGTNTGQNFTAYQIHAFFFGGKWTAQQAADFRTDLNALLTSGGNFNVTDC